MAVFSSRKLGCCVSKMFRGSNSAPIAMNGDQDALDVDTRHIAEVTTSVRARKPSLASANTSFRFPGYTSCLQVAILLLASLATGCASVSSVEKPNSARDARGLIYRLPLKLVIVTLEVDADGKRAISVRETAAFGDPSTLFVARFRGSAISNGDLTLSADSTGLLQTEQAFISESQLGAGLDALATFLGERESGDQAPEPGERAFDEDDNPCSAEGKYEWLIGPTDIAHDETMEKCGVFVDIRDVTQGDAENLGKAPVKEGTSAAGLFYRQATPYEVYVADRKDNVSQTTVHALPSSESPTGFIPVSRTLFAKNSTKLTFADGVPTKYVVDQESEWLAFAKLPSSVLNAYIKGVGAGFKSRKSMIDEEKAYLTSLSQLQAQKAKTAACLAELAKEAPDTNLVSTLCQ